MRKPNNKIQNIGSLFDTYKKRLQAPQKVVVEAFQEVIQDLVGAHIDIKDCEYTVRNRTLKLTASGPIKTEVMIRKKEILTHLKGRLGEKSAPTEIL